MAKKRKFVAYRRLDGRAYTRTSRYRHKSFIRMTKNPRIVRWHMGNKTKEFPITVRLITREALQIRDLALESARMTANRVVEKVAGKEGYHLHLRLYPHHILRENALASGAGADRLSTGMKMSFGKTIGIAARLKVGQEVMRIDVGKQHTDLAKEALRRAKSKLPGGYAIEVIDNTKTEELPTKEAAKTASKPAPKKEEVQKEAPVEEKVEAEPEVKAEEPAEVTEEKPAQEA